jgi:hypothetical protein
VTQQHPVIVCIRLSYLDLTALGHLGLAERCLGVIRESLGPVSCDVLPPSHPNTFLRLDVL